VIKRRKTPEDGSCLGEKTANRRCRIAGKCNFLWCERGFKSRGIKVLDLPIVGSHPCSIMEKKGDILRDFIRKNFHRMWNVA